MATMVSTAVGAQTVSKRKLEELVDTIIQQRAGTKVVSVECPVGIPRGIGQRAVCTATDRDGSSFSIELIQTDEDGGVNFTIQDAAAVEALEPSALEFYERWKAGAVDTIFAEAHQTFKKTTSSDNLTRLLQCTAAELGGLEGPGEAHTAVMNRSDGSAQIIPEMRFGAGASPIKLSYQQEDGRWQLTTVSMPVLDVDYSVLTPDVLLGQAAEFLSAADADQWSQVVDWLSHELLLDTSEKQVREQLDDPWKLGPVQTLEMTSYGRNRSGLPFLLATAVRAEGQQRTMFVFRPCGDEWKIRVFQLLPPDAQPQTAALQEVQTSIVQALHERGADVSLDCPGNEIALVPGITYTCEAKHESGLTAALEISGGPKGDVAWELLADDAWNPLLEQSRP
jgi:hypothetical protein